MPPEVQETTTTEPNTVQVSGDMIRDLHNAFSAFKEQHQKQLEDIKKSQNTDEQNGKVEELKKTITDLQAEVTAVKSENTAICEQLAEAQNRYLKGQSEVKKDDKYGHIDKSILEATKTYLLTGNANPQILQPMNLNSTISKAISTDVPAAGGVALPEDMAALITAYMYDFSDMRQVCRVVQSDTTRYVQPVELGGFAGGWINETGTRTETATGTFDNFVPTFGENYCLPKASNLSMSALSFDVVGYVTRGSARTFAQMESDAAWNHDGTNGPTGIYTYPTATTDDSSRAYGTIQYFPSGSAGSLGTDFNEFKRFASLLKRQYQRNGAFFANRLTLAELLVLSTQDGIYYWQPSVQLGTPPTLLGYPVYDTPEAQDIATDAFPVALADMDQTYHFVDIAGPVNTIVDQVTQKGFTLWYVYRWLAGGVANSESIKLYKTGTT